MAHIVYILCALTSLASAILLFRGYLKNKNKLLFWSSFGFLGFGVNNTILFIDLLVVPEIDLSIIRVFPALIGMLIFVSGLIFGEE